MSNLKESDYIGTFSKLAYKVVTLTFLFKLE